MKNFILNVLMTLVAFSCHAEITQVNDMKEVFEYFADADSKTLAIFDVDWRKYAICNGDHLYSFIGFNWHSTRFFSRGSS